MGLTAALVVTLGVLGLHNVGVELLPAAAYVPACMGTAAALVGVARWASVGGGDLGLTGESLGAGAVAGAAVALLLGVAALLPRTRPFFADGRMAGVGPMGTAYRALVRIPVGTVALEEIAFRGVLLGLFDRLVPVPWAVGGSCLLFGLWHVVPMKATLATNGLPVRPAVVGAAAVATALAGAGLCWLRLSTGGLAAPAVVHAAASATATVAAFFVVRRRQRRR